MGGFSMAYRLFSSFALCFGLLFVAVVVFFFSLDIPMRRSGCVSGRISDWYDTLWDFFCLFSYMRCIRFRVLLILYVYATCIRYRVSIQD